jgi:hypothetical protein
VKHDRRPRIPTSITISEELWEELWAFGEELARELGRRVPFSRVLELAALRCLSTPHLRRGLSLALHEVDEPRRKRKSTRLRSAPRPARETAA